MSRKRPRQATGDIEREETKEEKQPARRLRTKEPASQQEREISDRINESLTMITSIARVGRTVMIRFQGVPKAICTGTVARGLSPKTLSISGLSTNEQSFEIVLEGKNRNINLVQRRYMDKDLVHSRKETFIHPLDMRFLTQRAVYHYMDVKCPKQDRHLVFICASTQSRVGSWTVDNGLMLQQVAVDIQASFHHQAIEDVVGLLARFNLSAPLGRLVSKYLLPYHKEGICPCIACEEENERRRKIRAEIDRLDAESTPLSQTIFGEVLIDSPTWRTLLAKYYAICERMSFLRNDLDFIV